MKIIKLILGVILLVGWIFYTCMGNWSDACICGLAILAIINSHRIDELEDRK